jgi:hypothetical protein
MLPNEVVPRAGTVAVLRADIVAVDSAPTVDCPVAPRVALTSALEVESARALMVESCEVAEDMAIYATTPRTREHRRRLEVAVVASFPAEMRSRALIPYKTGYYD